MNRSKSVRALVGVASVLALFAVAGCGGDDDSAELEPEAEATTSAEAIDAAAFESCILNASIDRGAYEQVPEPAPEVVQVAEDNGAEFFEASKADEGLVFFYVPEDPATTGDLAAALEPVLADLAATLAEGAPKNIELGEAAVETEGPVVFGLVPFSAEQAAEMSEGARADIADCVSES